MTGIVLELQKEALDSKVRVSDLLRKALLVARKLRVSDIESWIQSELNGYKDEASFPPYREVTGEIKAWNPFTGAWMPILFHESQAGLHRSLTRRKCNQSVAEIESLLAGTKSGYLGMPYAHEAQAKLMKAADLPTPPVLLVSEARLHGILDAVRTAVLEWALKLEESGILGENLSFSEEDRRAASHIVFNVGSMSNSQIQAGTTESQQSLQQANFDPQELLVFVERAAAAIDQLNLPAESSQELRGELRTIEAQSTSPKPKKQIIRESMKSVRAILEGAGGNAVAEGLLAALKVLLG